MIPIEGVLDKYEVQYNADRDGNQSVKCPFHDDTRASASVNLGEGLFKCFSCDAAGTAITLLMEYEGLSGREAERVAQELADAAGAPVSRGTGRRNDYLPSRKRTRPGRRGWKPPWTRSGA